MPQTSCPTPARLRPAFTLVELLVVIAIVGVLIAMLLPALNEARDQVKLLGCRANLRAITIGFYQYARDNRGWLPPSELTWHKEIDSYLPSTSKSYFCPAARAVNYLSPYGSDGYIKGFPSYSIQAQTYGRYVPVAATPDVYAGCMLNIEASTRSVRVHQVDSAGNPTDKGAYGGTGAKDIYPYRLNPMVVESIGSGAGPANIHGNDLQANRHPHWTMNYISADLGVASVTFAKMDTATRTTHLITGEGGQVWARVVGDTAFVENGKTYGVLADWPYKDVTEVTPGLVPSF